MGRRSKTRLVRLVLTHSAFLPSPLAPRAIVVAETAQEYFIVNLFTTVEAGAARPTGRVEPQGE